MADPKPSQTAFWLQTLATNADLQSLTSLIVDTLGTKLPGKTLEERTDMAEDQFEAVAALLESERERQKEDGIEPTFELSYETGAPYFRKIASDADRFLKALFGISDKEFVDFCVLLLRS